MTYHDQLLQIADVVAELKDKLATVPGIITIGANIADYSKASELPAAYVKFNGSTWPDVREMDNGIHEISIFIKNQSTDELGNMDLIADVCATLEDYPLGGECKGASITSINTWPEGRDVLNLTTEIVIQVTL